MKLSSLLFAILCLGATFSASAQSTENSREARQQQLLDQQQLEGKVLILENQLFRLTTAVDEADAESTKVIHEAMLAAAKAHIADRKEVDNLTSVGQEILQKEEKLVAKMEPARATDIKFEKEMIAKFEAFLALMKEEVAAQQ